MGALRIKEPLRIGFLPVSDCAPVVYAHEAGLFDKYELDVELHCENTWANIRDKIINGDLDAAHAPASLPFLANIGLESDQCPCVSGLILNLQGNAITLSKQLWDLGVQDAASLRDRIYKQWGKRTFTFGIVFPFTAPDFLLRQWLKSGGIVPESEVRIIVVPPNQMYPMLKLGYIDGYCVGEPWTSLAVQAGAGVCAATSAELAPLHPEKALVVRQSFSIGRADEHERMIAALIEACAFCDRPENRGVISDMLAQPKYINAPAETIRAGLVGPFDTGGHRIQSLLDLNLFHRHNANEPSNDKATWIMDHLYGLLQQKYPRRPGSGRAPILQNVFRRDIYERAKILVSQQACQVAAAADSFLAQTAVSA
jgi:ABC-type nitrate/sulfonate/bicarbonate transport system substrate-binding protein